jgi:hypothetical protein
MLYLFDVIKDKIKLKHCHCIDNWVFKLHYRATTIIYLIATILVTSREYMGEHIQCITDIKENGFQKVVDTFCFFTSTFSVVNDEDASGSDLGFMSHPGIAPFGIGSKQKIRRHMYYQWVPFLLFGQAIMFYLIHLLWKSLEDGRMGKLVSGLTHSKFSVLEKEVEVDGEVVPTREQKKNCIRRIKTSFMERISLNRSWSAWFFFCEVLNFLNVMLQIYITHKFLGNQFYTLGPKVVRDGSHILEEVFPKVTKCTFHKYGPSGSIQVHDALCVMALNIINEKIYVFLWFWLVLLFAISCLILVWRLVTFLFFSRCMLLNRLVFGHAKLYYWNLNIVVRQCSYNDWFLLKYLSKNMDGMSFRELFADISEDLEEKKPLKRSH